jgi:lipase chaperone LimK
LPARRVLAAGGIAAALVAAGIALVLGGGAGSRTAAPGEGVSASVSGPDGTGPAFPPLPASLEGTEVAGALPVDPRGHLRVVPAVLELFDWFLAASGEEPIAQTRARIEAEIRARLEPPAEGEALALLDRYLAYREAVRVLAESDASGLSLERRIQRVRELRRATFGADAEALFGAEEDRVRVDLERRRVALDPDLSEAERARRLAALDAELPDEVREARDAALVATRLREEERALRERGAGPAEIEALRERRVGVEAAARLAALDRERAVFDSRLETYRRERDALLERRFDDAAEREESLSALRQEHFDGSERVRVEALDRAEAARVGSDTP